MKRGLTVTLALAAAAAGLAVQPAAGVAAKAPAEDAADGRGKARVGVQVRGLDGRRAKIGRRVTVVGKLRPFVKGERLRVVLLRNGKAIAKRTTAVSRVPGRNAGRVRIRSERLSKQGRYTARAIHPVSPQLSRAQGGRGPFRLSFPSLQQGDRGPEVKIFNRLLRRAGYGNAPSGRKLNAASARAVHAFRKVNGMSWNERATSTVFRRLAAGKGAFKLRYPGAGKHVEVDVSRQVMVLAKGGEPRYTYHVSTGASSTPSDYGKFRFYRKDPGYNSIGMYYSVYYNRGEATHGYHSVPDYPASHGCIRNPIPDSIFIYSWIDLGDPIWVYN